MKKFLLGALLCSLIFSCMSSMALAQKTYDLPADPEVPYYLSADESFDLSDAGDGTKWRFLTTLYGRGAQPACMNVVVRVDSGQNLYPQVVSGGVSVYATELRRTDETKRHDYTFFLLNISCNQKHDDLKPEEFSVSLSTLDKIVTIGGSCEISPTQGVLSGTDYRLRHGSLIRIDEELYEAATMSAPPLTLTFPKGEYFGYSKEPVSLALSRRLPEKTLAGTISSFWFVDTPSFPHEIGVSILAPEGSEVYEALLGGRFLKINSSYEDGALSFNTNILTRYIVVNKSAAK